MSEQLCEYEACWTDEVGEIPVCKVHGNNSRHDVGPNRPCLTIDPHPQEQLPTLPGKVDGIVGLDPLVLQCRDCGATYTGTRARIAADIILSGYRFHICEGQSGNRRCPDCLAVVETACPHAGRHR